MPTACGMRPLLIKHGDAFFVGDSLAGKGWGHCFSSLGKFRGAGHCSGVSDPQSRPLNPILRQGQAHPSLRSSWRSGHRFSGVLGFGKVRVTELVSGNFRRPTIAFDGALYHFRGLSHTHFQFAPPRPTPWLRCPPKLILILRRPCDCSGFYSRAASSEEEVRCR